MNSKRPKIAVVSWDDPFDKKVLSGTLFSMVCALKNHCGEVISLGPINYKINLFSKCIRKIINTGFKKKYSFKHSIMLSKHLSKIFSNRLRYIDADLIFAPFASAEIAFLNSSIPIIYLADATFKLLTNYYFDYTNLCYLSVFEGNLIEKLAIQKSHALIFSSEWAAQSAINDYAASPDKIKIIPFGPNIETIPSTDLIYNKRKSEKCRILFVGKNWERKGGYIAYETLLELEKMGVKAELIICGCVPPSGFAHKDMRVIPFLNKNVKSEKEKLNKVFLSADIFLLPTKSDCTPIVFCEANAYGLPVITTDIGGVSGIINNGENGFVLPVGAKGIDYAKLIQRVCRDDEFYTRLVRNSRKMFEKILNWTAWGESVNETIQNLLQV